MDGVFNTNGGANLGIPQINNRMVRMFKWFKCKYCDETGWHSADGPRCHDGGAMPCCCKVGKKISGEFSKFRSNLAKCSFCGRDINS